MKTKIIPQKKSDNNFVLKLEFVKWVLTFFLSAIVIGIVLKLVNAFYEPNIQASLDLAKEILVSPAQALPEPKEKLMFVIGLLTGTLSLGVFYSFLNSYYKKKNQSSIDSLYLFTLIAGTCSLLFVLYKSLVAPNPFAAGPQNAHDVVAKTNADFYFIKTFLYKNFYLFLVVLYPIILLSLINVFKLSSTTISKVNKVTRYIVLVFSLALIFVVCFISTFDFPYTFENKYDLNAVYYSLVQVYHGFPLLVDNFTNTYGLYPHFIVPVLKLTGLSIHNFSLIMGLLLSLCFLLMYYFLAKNISNKWIVLFGFTSIFYNSYMYVRVVTNFDSVFSTSPIRWLFPCLLLAFSALYLSFNSKLRSTFLFKKNIPFIHQYGITPIKLVSFLFFSMGILWSPDTGTFTFLALLSFYVYQEIDIKNIKNTIVKAFVHAVFAVLIAVSVVLLFMWLIKLSYGVSPDILLMFSTINVFSSLGFGMLPMSDTWHVWMLVVIVYLFGLLYSIVAVLKQRITPKSTTIFLLTVLGILFFLYYQGRSHNWNLLIINFPVFMLLAVFCNELLVSVKIHNMFMVPFGITLFFISFSIFQIISDKDKIIALIYSKHDKEINYAEQQRILSTAKIIDDLTADNEKVFVLSSEQNQCLYHNFSKTSSVFSPGFVELFTNKAFDTIINRLVRNDIKVFYEPQLFRFSNNKIQTVLSSVYDVNKEFNKESLVWYLEKKHENEKSSVLLENSNEDALHELFDKNFANKLDYALGKGKVVSLSPKFSIQIIFKPAPLANSQITESATLLCNADQTKGFVLQQNRDNPNQYIFAANNQGILCPVIPGKWNYLALEVDGDKLKGYSNGRFVGNVQIKTGYENSDKPLFVGSMNMMGGFFFGDIKELQIKNTLLDTVTMKQNWQKINAL